MIHYKPLLSIARSLFIKVDNKGQMLFVEYFAGLPRVFGTRALLFNQTGKTSSSLDTELLL